jgi:hypothetical protein
MVLATGTNSAAIYIGLGVGFLIWAVCLWWTIQIARKKNRSTVGWGALAFFFSWIALIVVLLLPSRAPVGDH